MKQNVIIYLIMPLLILAIFTATGQIKWFPKKEEKEEQERRGGRIIKKNVPKWRGKILIIKR